MTIRSTVASLLLLVGFGFTIAVLTGCGGSPPQLTTARIEVKQKNTPVHGVTIRLKYADGTERTEELVDGVASFGAMQPGKVQIAFKNPPKKQTPPPGVVVFDPSDPEMVKKMKEKGGNIPDLPQTQAKKAPTPVADKYLKYETANLSIELKLGQSNLESLDLK